MFLFSAKQLKKKLIKRSWYKMIESKIEKEELFDDFYSYTDLMREFEDK